MPAYKRGRFSKSIVKIIIIFTYWKIIEKIELNRTLNINMYVMPDRQTIFTIIFQL